MNIISNNPFRILGVPTNASAREIVSNQSRLNAYLTASKSIRFPIDGIEGLPLCVRNKNTINAANSEINLPEDKMKYSLFWFAKPDGGPEEIAWNHLLVGNTDKAKQLFGIKDSWISVINLAVLSLLVSDVRTAIYCYYKLLSTPHLRTEFFTHTIGETFTKDWNLVLNIVLNELCIEKGAEKILETLEWDGGLPQSVVVYLADKAVEQPISQIEEAIKESKSLDAENPVDSFLSAHNLIDLAKELLPILQKHSSELRIQKTIDKLSNRILQCGINYYNHTDDADDIEKALPTQTYAASIAVGTLTKERCKKNVGILYSLYYKRSIIQTIEKYRKSKMSIGNIHDLLQASACHLVEWSTIDANTDNRIKLSSHVAVLALNGLIDIVINTRKPGAEIFDYIQSIGLLEMNHETKDYYQRNLNQLRDILKIVKTSCKGKIRFCTEEEYANSVDNPTSCERYLTLFPRGLFREAVEVKLKDYLFSECHTIEKCCQFLKRYPQSKESLDNRMYQCCKTSNDLETYLSHYPSGNHYQEAYQKKIVLDFRDVDSLEKAKAFLIQYPGSKFQRFVIEKIEKFSLDLCTTISQYQQFLNDFPKSKYINTAQNAIERLSFNRCRSLSDYESFLNQFPNGQFVSLAISRIQEERFWESVRGINKSTLVKKYLDIYPKGHHAIDAAEIIRKHDSKKGWIILSIFLVLVVAVCWWMIDIINNM